MVYTSPTKKARIVEFNKLGYTHTKVAAQLGLHRTTVSRYLKKHDKLADFYAVAPKTGRPRKLTPRDAKLGARMLAKAEVANAAELQKKVFPHVGLRTVHRNLYEQGLVARVRRKVPFLSKIQKSRRRSWALEHATWKGEDWDKVIFSDESKFMLFKSDGRQYCWIKPGQALDDRFTQKTVKHGGGSIMVWGCITSKGMGRLYRIDGIMKGPDYVEILDKQFLGTLKDRKLRKTHILFQQDNDPKHTSKVAENWFRTKHVKKLPWPSSSPDMNIIEHIWQQLDSLVRARDPLPRNKEELWVALQEEWTNFPKAALDKLYQSMPSRVAALLKARGSMTLFGVILDELQPKQNLSCERAILLAPTVNGNKGSAKR